MAFTRKPKNSKKHQQNTVYLAPESPIHYIIQGIPSTMDMQGRQYGEFGAANGGARDWTTGYSQSPEIITVMPLSCPHHHFMNTNDNGNHRATEKVLSDLENIERMRRLFGTTTEHTNHSAAAAAATAVAEKQREKDKERIKELEKEKQLTDLFSAILPHLTYLPIQHGIHS